MAVRNYTSTSTSIACVASSCFVKVVTMSHCFGSYALNILHEHVNVNHFNPERGKLDQYNI